MIFDVEFEKTEAPFGVSVSLTYPGSKNQIKWFTPISAHDLEVKTNHDTGEQTPILKTATINISKAQVIEELRVAESRGKNAKNPAYWAHSCEDKVNGIKQQVEQNLPEGDPTRALISMISDLLSDHIYAMGKEEEPSQ